MFKVVRQSQSKSSMAWDSSPLATIIYKKIESLYKTLNVLLQVNIITDILIVFNWNHFEMRFLNLRFFFFYLLWTFCPHLGSFLCCFFWCDRQQLCKAVITGNTVTRLSIPIRGRGKINWRRPEMKFGRIVVKEETTQKTTKMRTKSSQ